MLKSVSKFLFIAFIILSSSMSDAQDTTFFTAIEDLPMMIGMTERTEMIVSFDTPEGRIVETQGVIRTSVNDVEEFYGQALPALGWEAQSGRLFQRGAELLEVDISYIDRVTTVRFYLHPVNYQPPVPSEEPVP